MMPRDRFVFLENFKATADLLDNKNKLAFYDAVCDYVFKDIEPTDPYISALLNSIKPSLNRVDGRCNNGGNHNPTGKNQHTAKLVNSGQSRSNLVKSLVNSGQSLSDNIDNNININITQELDSNNTGKSNKGVIGGKEKGDSFVAELEKQELAKVKSKTDDDFDRFWAAYTPVRCSDGRMVPKGSKKETRAKFDKYIKAGVKADDIIDGAKKYLASCQANDRLSCGATVFLNQERWKDDWSAQGIQATRKAKSISSPDYVGEGSFLRRAEDDPFCADL